MQPLPLHPDRQTGWQRRDVIPPLDWGNDAVSRVAPVGLMAAFSEFWASPRREKATFSGKGVTLRAEGAESMALRSWATAAGITVKAVTATRGRAATQAMTRRRMG